jgi:hypothetical protein
VPTGARWELLSFNVGFLPGAIVAPRTPILVGSTSACLVFEVAAPGGVDAPNNIRVSWQSGLGVSTPKVGVRLSQSLPVSIPMPAAGFFATLTDALQAADQYTFVHYTVREWLEVL